MQAGEKLLRMPTEHLCPLGLFFFFRFVFTTLQTMPYLGFNLPIRDLCSLIISMLLPFLELFHTKSAKHTNATKNSLKIRLCLFVFVVSFCENII